MDNPASSPDHIKSGFSSTGNKSFGLPNGFSPVTSLALNLEDLSTRYALFNISVVEYNVCVWTPFL